MSEELKPCPFCGGNDIGSSYIETYSTDSSYDVFGCRGCGARFEDGSEKDWNTRAELASVKAGQGEAMTTTRYKVIETALCIGDSVFEGEEVVVLAAEYERLEQERDQWHQLCAEAQVQRDQYQDQRDAALKQVEGLREELSVIATGCICEVTTDALDALIAALQAKP